MGCLSRDYGDFRVRRLSSQLGITLTGLRLRDYGDSLRDSTSAVHRTLRAQPVFRYLRYHPARRHCCRQLQCGNNHRPRNVMVVSSISEETMLGWTIGISRRGIAASLACIAISSVAVAQDMQPTPAPSTTAAMPAPNTVAVPPASPATRPAVSRRPPGPPHSRV